MTKPAAFRMQTAATAVDSRPSTIDVFVARCEALAMLVAHGQEDLANAVDRLQAAAVRTGVIDEFGQDTIQAIMAKAFESYRGRS